MKQKIIIAISVLLWLTNLEGQTLSPAVLGTSGGYGVGGEYSLSWTLGETIITTINAGDYMLTQGFQQSDKFSALPVSIIDFNAIRQNRQDVVLKWQTASENNNSGFYIERRLESENDFTIKNFESSKAIGGNSTLKLSYTYSDPNSFTGISYYRLKQLDRDGHSTYTIIKAVNGITNATVSLVIFPNPNNGQFKIITQGLKEPAIAVIMDINGKVMKRLSIMNGVPAFISNLVSGTYIVTITDAFGTGKTFNEKVIVGK